MFKRIVFFVAVLVFLLVQSCRTPIAERYPEPVTFRYPPQETITSYEDPGEEVYMNKCAVCHRLGVTLVGPNLGCITDRRSDEWIASFIRNSQDLIKEGDENAVSIFQEFNQIPMPGFPFLSDIEMMDLLNYLKNDCSQSKLEYAESYEDEFYSSSLKDAPEIFKRKCATCHQLDKDGTAPKLRGILDRIPSEKWFADYIRDEDSLLKIKDPYAVQIDNWNENFSWTHRNPDITDAEIKELIDYTK